MSNKEYELLGIETIIDETGGTESSTAQILLLTNGEPKAIFIVPVYGRATPQSKEGE